MKIDRREFLKVSAAAGGAIAFEFAAPAQAAGNRTPAYAGVTNSPAGAPGFGMPDDQHEVTHWLVIYPDDRVVIRIARSEMGQGSLTGLAQLVAEELECDWNKVATEFASPNEHIKRKRIWGSMSTGGSAGVRTSQEYLRKSGAQARTMLVSAAAQQWNVDPSECKVAKGVITHGKSKRRTTYGKVAAAAGRMEAPKDVKLKDAKDWTIAGKPMRRLEMPDKVRGLPVYGVDVELPGMLKASIVQSPVFLGKLKSVDSAEAEKMRGVKGIVKGDDFVAVVADNWWRANEAAKKLNITWDEGDNAKVSSETIAAMFREGLDAKDLPAARKIGDAPGALASAAKVVEAEYSSPYLNHATMEPMTSTAWFKDDGTLEVWTSTQNAEASIATASETAGIPLEKCEVHKTMLGGGFGRRGAAQDYVKQSVLIAKQFPGKPVKLIWSREEDMQHGFYRPASLVRMRAGLDAQGNVVAMHTVIACPSILALLRPEGIDKGIDSTAVRTFSDATYQVPNQLVEYAMRNPPRAGRLLARARAAELVLSRMLHGRARRGRRQGSARVPPRHAQARRQESPHARGGGEGREVGLAAAAGRLSRHRAVGRLRQLHRDGRGSLRRRCEDQGAQGLLRDRLGLRREPRHVPRAGRGQRDLQHRAALRGEHGEGRPRGAVQLPRLPVAAPVRDARGRDGLRAQRRLLGRPRRARGAERRAGDPERGACGDGEAHPLAAAQGR
jgi:isoquinoline 1-oxidoreductase beta subunit